MSKVFDFKSAIAKAEKRLKNNTLGLIVLGSSGSGKSALTGTTGLKTLYLYLSGETHGPKSAKTYGKGDIDAIMIDDDGRNPDEAFTALLNILDEQEGVIKAGYKAIVIDGATELEALIRKTSIFKKACQTSNGSHNNFAEPAAVQTMFREVMSRLRLLGDQGVHYIMTCILDVKSMDDDTGEIAEATPRLSTYSVAESIIQQFPDVVAIGRMSNGEKTAHRIQLCSGISKASKTANGAVKKMINFHPRLTGVLTLPPHMPADLSKVIELKQGEAK